ncbi:MAG: hydrogenase maturation protease [Ilumatobacteraceae bacterium]
MSGRLDAEPILIAGVGNIFRSDDGFGSAVANAMLAGDVPDGVRVVDYGIRGVHLAFDLSEAVRTLILVDTVPDAGGPGSIVVQEVDPASYGSATFDAHSMDPNTVLGSVATLGDSMPRTLVIGCEPANLDDGIGLSPAVESAVPVAARKALELAMSELDSMKGIR